MIYVTGDMHGDPSRFRAKALRRLKKGDTLIVCGDFGFVWDGSEKEKRILAWIGRRRYNVLFVEGVHDNLSLIEAFPEEHWNGGKTHLISGRLRHLVRGGVFTIEGLRVLAFGGGENISLEGMLDWWDRLLPSPAELDETRALLTRLGNEVDYIVTHQCGRKLRRLLSLGDRDEMNVLDAFFDELRAGLKHKGWFFGGHHIDRFIPPFEAALYEEVVALDGEIKMSNTHAARRARIKRRKK